MEVERALEILRARKANFDRFNRIFRLFVVPTICLSAVLLVIFIAFAVLKGELHYVPVLIAILVAGVLFYLILLNDEYTPADWALRNWGYSRSDGVILQEQIDEHERQLAALRRGTT